VSVSEHPNPAAELTLRGITLDVAGCCVRVEGHLVPLAPMELTVLKVLMENAGTVVSLPDLLAKAWGEQSSTDYRSLKVHILRLRRKIETDPHAPTLIRTVRQSGYVFDRYPR